MTELFDNWMTRFWDWIDSRGVIRRVMMFATMWMCWLAGEHAYNYAMAALAAGKADAGIGAVIAAFTAPASMLAGYVFKSYIDSRAA